MKKIKYIALIIVAIIVIVLSFSSVINKIVIKYKGQEVVATVTEIPVSCDRYNHIKVSLNNTQYEVKISRIDCRDGLYKIGQKVKLLKHERYKELVWPESQPELLILVFVAAFILVYFSIKSRYKK